MGSCRGSCRGCYWGCCLAGEGISLFSSLLGSPRSLRGRDGERWLSFTNRNSLPCYINDSIYIFKSKQSSVLYSWSRWKRQYLSWGCLLGGNFRIFPTSALSGVSRGRRVVALLGRYLDLSSVSQEKRSLYDRRTLLLSSSSPFCYFRANFEIWSF